MDRDMDAGTEDKSMEDTMGDVFDRLQKEDGAKDDGGSTQPDDSDTDTGTDADGGRPRGPDGKFIAKEAADDAPQADTETPGHGADTRDEPPPAAIEPPVSWSAQAKAEFAKVPPIVQREILKREADIAKGLDERTAKLKGYAPIEAALEPIRQQLELNGLDPASWIRRVAAAELYLQRNPAEAIQWLAKQYGVNLAAPQQPAEDEYVDPQVAALKSKLDQLTGYLQQTAVAQQHAMTGQLQSQIEAFRADPAHTYFEEARQDMAALIQTGRATDLKQAYDMAIWARPDLRTKIMASERAAEEAKRKAEAEKRASAARKAGATNLGTRGTSAGSTPTAASIEEEMGQVYDRLHGAA